MGNRNRPRRRLRTKPPPPPPRRCTVGPRTPSPTVSRRSPLGPRTPPGPRHSPSRSRTPPPPCRSPAGPRTPPSPVDRRGPRDDSGHSAGDKRRRRRSRSRSSSRGRTPPNLRRHDRRRQDGERPLRDEGRPGHRRQDQDPIGVDQLQAAFPPPCSAAGGRLATAPLTTAALATPHAGAQAPPVDGLWLAEEHQGAGPSRPRTIHYSRDRFRLRGVDPPGYWQSHGYAPVCPPRPRPLCPPQQSYHGAGPAPWCPRPYTHLGHPADYPAYGYPDDYHYPGYPLDRAPRAYSPEHRGFPPPHPTHRYPLPHPDQRYHPEHPYHRHPPDHPHRGYLAELLPREYHPPHPPRGYLLENPYRGYPPGHPAGPGYQPYPHHEYYSFHADYYPDPHSEPRSPQEEPADSKAPPPLNEPPPHCDPLSSEQDSAETEELQPRYDSSEQSVQDVQDEGYPLKEEISADEEAHSLQRLEVEVDMEDTKPRTHSLLTKLAPLVEPYKLRGNPRISRPDTRDLNFNEVPKHIRKYQERRDRSASRQNGTGDFTEDVGVEDGSFLVTEEQSEGLKSPLGCVLVRGGPDSYERHSLVLKTADLRQDEVGDDHEPDLRESLSRKTGEVHDLREALSRKLGDAQDLREALSRKPLSLARQPCEGADLRQSLSRRHPAGVGLRISLRAPCEESDLRETLSRKKATDDLRNTLDKKRSPVKLPVEVVDIRSSSSPDQQATHTSPPPSPVIPPAPAPSPALCVTPSSISSSPQSEFTSVLVHEGQDQCVPTGQAGPSQEDPVLLTVASELREILEDYETVEGQSLLNSLASKSKQKSCPKLVTSSVDFELFPLRQRASDFFGHSLADTEQHAQTLPSSPHHSGKCNFNIPSTLQHVEAFLATLRYEVESENESKNECKIECNAVKEPDISGPEIRKRVRKRNTTVTGPDIRNRLRKRTAVTYTYFRPKKILKKTKLTINNFRQRVKKILPNVQSRLDVISEEAASCSEDDMPLIQRLRKKQAIE